MTPDFLNGLESEFPDKELHHNSHPKPLCPGPSLGGRRLTVDGLGPVLGYGESKNKGVTVSTFY